MPPDTETPTPLAIPDEARAAWQNAVREDGLRGAGAFVIAPQAVRAAAPIIVATELRRMADEMEVGFQPHRIGRAVESSSGLRREGVELAVAYLRARADQLDPGHAPRTTV